MNTADKAKKIFDEAVKGQFVHDEQTALEYVLNVCMDEVSRVSLLHNTIDFKDGSIFIINRGHHVTAGFYAITQEKRA